MKKDRIQSILLVEGKDDKHVIWSLLQHYNIPEDFTVIDCDGIENLLKELTLRLTTPAMYKCIGVVMDADVNIRGRYDAFRGILENTGHYFFNGVELSDTGLLVNSNDVVFPIVGLWLMPNNKSNGMLEDFVMTLANGNEALMTEADSVLCTIEGRKLNRYPTTHRSKAKIHTYLAWQEEPGKPMGLAITAKVLDAGSPTAKVFIDWIRQLFIATKQS